MLLSEFSVKFVYRLLLALLIGSLAMAACTSPAQTTEQPEDTEAPEGTEAPEETAEAETLHVMFFGPEAGDDIVDNRLAFFSSKYPDVELTFTEGGFDEQTFLTAVASGDVPDLVYMGRDVIGTYAARGALQPLDECIASQDIDMSQYYEAAVNEVTFNGVVYGIPEFFNFVVIIGNQAALDEAGLTIEDLDTSDWEHLAEVNEALTKIEDSQLVRIGFDPKLPEFLPLWAMANGVSLISEDGRTANLNDPKVVEALEFAASLHEPAGGRADFMAFRDTWDFFGAENQVAKDQIGAWPMEQWYANVLANNSPDAPAVFTLFRDREGNPISFATGNTWAVPTGAENVEAACAFMKTMTSVDAWVDASQKRADARAAEGRLYTGTYTGNREADAIIFGEILQPTGNAAFDAGIDVLLEAMGLAFSMPANPAGQEFKDAWTAAVNAVLNGEMSAQEALDIAQDEAQAALDEAWSQVE